MSGWDPYVETLMKDGSCQDAAIVGHCPFSVWAACPDGKLRSITSDEVASIVSTDRSNLPVNGLKIAGEKCSLIRDQLHSEDNYTMDVRTKSSSGDPTFNVAIAKTGQALVIVKGNAGVHGGNLNGKVHDMAKYLRSLNM